MAKKTTVRSPAAPLAKAAPARKITTAATAKAKVVQPEPLALALAIGAEDTPADNEDFSIQAIRLAFLIHDVSRMRRAVYDQIMKPLNFTRARWWVLAHLSRHDGMMQSQLADVLEVGKASLGSVVEQLETDGWLERRSDPSDKRAKRVYLTRAAQPFIKKMTLEEDDFNRKILAGLDGADRANLIRMLAQVKESLQKFPKPESGSED